MLHHLPSVALQDHLLAEVARVLRPGGIFAGVHLFDTMGVVDPGSFPKRLQAAGFVDVRN
jgi:ubiquinone/menaquinone biosynthesis C-methylase UbiE